MKKDSKKQRGNRNYFFETIVKEHIVLNDFLYTMGPEPYHGSWAFNLLLYQSKIWLNIFHKGYILVFWLYNSNNPMRFWIISRLCLVGDILSLIFFLYIAHVILDKWQLEVVLVMLMSQVLYHHLLFFNVLLNLHMLKFHHNQNKCQRILLNKGQKLHLHLKALKRKPTRTPSSVGSF